MVDSVYRQPVESTSSSLWEMNSVYRFHLRWSKRGIFCEILETLAVKISKDPIRAIDATYIKVHQDACRHTLRPEERGLGKTKGGRNSKVHACVNGKGKAVKLMLLPGNEHEVKTAHAIVGNMKNKIILADRG